MNFSEQEETVRNALQSSGVDVVRVETRSFPGEHWLIVFVAPAQLPLAQTLAGAVEERLNSDVPVDGDSTIVTFRARRQAQST